MVLCKQGGQGLVFAVSGVPGLKKKGGRKEERILVLCWQMCTGLYHTSVLG